MGKTADYPTGMLPVGTASVLGIGLWSVGYDFLKDHIAENEFTSRLDEGKSD
jgi:hypothetical protein